MAKRYLHTFNGSKIVEDNSKEMEDMLASGKWFKLKSDIPIEDVEENTIDVTSLPNKELQKLYDEVDDEMLRRGLFDTTEQDNIDYNSLELKQLKEIAKEEGIKGYGTMKRETLIKALEEGK